MCRIQQETNLTRLKVCSHAYYMWMNLALVPRVSNERLWVLEQNQSPRPGKMTPRPGERPYDEPALRHLLKTQLRQEMLGKALVPSLCDSQNHLGRTEILRPAPDHLFRPKDWGDPYFQSNSPPGPEGQPCLGTPGLGLAIYPLLRYWNQVRLPQNPIQITFAQGQPINGVGLQSPMPPRYS